MKTDSFRQRLESGASKEELMKFYGLTEKQYEKVIKSVENIKKKEVIK